MSSGPEAGARPSILGSRRYLTSLYSDERRPASDYPRHLAGHIRELYGDGGRLLDIGCGRGDMLRAFAERGFEVSGLDVSPAAKEMAAPHPVKIADLERDELPYVPGSFDCVFSKSVIEHMHDPLALLRASLEALRPGGVAVVMTPSWLHHGWGPFYLDFTDVRPFTAPALADALELAGFEGVEVRHFRQLPVLWRHRWLVPWVSLFARLPLPYRPMQRAPWPEGLNRFIRFSREVMLLGIARKPEDPGA